MKTSLLVSFLSMYCMISCSQNSTSMDSTIKSLSDEIKAFKKIQISGYVQPQFQYAEEKGIPFVGGNFAENVRSRFIIRRGRLRVAYISKPFEFELITDNSEKGVSLHDFSASYTFEKIKLKYTGGLFKRPFGFEQLYSSSSHEGPERSRFTNTLLPSEADLGFKLSYFNFKPITIEAGVFNGNSTASDVDSYKDFIARISIDKKISTSNLSGGISFYHGGLIQGTRYLYEMETVNGLKRFVLQDTFENTKGSAALRQYFGADIQYSFHTLLGKTTLRGEWMNGTQPGSDKTTDSPKTTTVPNYDTYSRKFDAFSSFFLQNFGETNLQLVVKYDWYDPNSDTDAEDIGKTDSKLTATDIKFSTLGLGLNYYFKNMYLMVYYDFVKNEKAPNLAGYEKDRKDNVLTIRTQLKF
jgi:hypothetical protein